MGAVWIENLILKIKGEAEARKTGFSHKAAKSAEGVDGRSNFSYLEFNSKYVKRR